jgi:hypothetical protein
MDRERWFSFITAAYREQAALDPSSLESWLMEEGWQLERARELALEYEFGRALLKSVDPIPPVSG